MNGLISQIDLTQILLASLTVTVAGVIGFWCRDLPLRVFHFIKRQCTTTVHLTSVNNSFHDLMKFLEKNYKDRNFRDFKLTNGKWGDDAETTIGIGYGNHLIKYKNKWLFIRLIRHESHGTSLDKESVSITKPGRDRKYFEEFFKDLMLDTYTKNMIQIYQMEDFWQPLTSIPKRSFDTIFLEQHKKDELLTLIDNFINREDWYVKNGIPYQLGILLHGESGTGKSSLIKAIASYLGYSIYYLSVGKIYKIERCMMNLPKKCILVIEDIDCSETTHDRIKKKDNNIITPDLSDIMSNFSDILNVIDGVCSPHGRILITTTNHIEMLDPALIRPGRIDKSIHMTYANLEVINQFLRRFYDSEITVDIPIKKDITTSQLQQMVLTDMKIDQVLEEIRL